MKIPLTWALAALACWLAWDLAAAPAPAAAASDDDREGAIRESVVKIFATMRPPDMLRPWSKQNPRDVSGTGVVIEGKRILTNAHVVLYTSEVFVQSYQSSEKLVAEVESVSPAMDLAVLKLEDESFFDGRKPLERTRELPEVKDGVLVYGYPEGGTSLSVTKGIVSRIEFTGYSQDASGLRIQVDAAINPGNSGGPALVDDRMIGLIFSRLRAADNIGYIIPSEEIELFLADVADGRYDGKPALYDQLQTLENDALRGYLKLDRKVAGMVVHHPEPARDPGSYPLREWDLITHIGDHEVDNTGMVRVQDDLRLRFHYLIQKLARDGKAPLKVLRQGRAIDVEVPVATRRPMLVESLRGRYPSYFVYGPLVFSPVTAEFLAGIDRGGPNLLPALSAIGSPLVTRRGDRPRFEGEELVVVASPMFPHRLAKGYSNPLSKVVKEVNGVPVRNLLHLVEILRDAQGPFVTFDFDDRNSETIVFNRAEAVRATDDILNDNGIRQQGSDDAMSVWRKQDKDQGDGDAGKGPNGSD